MQRVALVRSKSRNFARISQEGNRRDGAERREPRFMNEPRTRPAAGCQHQVLS